MRFVPHALHADGGAAPADLPAVGVRIAIACAPVATMAGGLLAAFADASGLSPRGDLVGLALFISGTLVAGAVAVRHSRGTGGSIPQSLWSGVRTALCWMWFFLP